MSHTKQPDKNVALYRKYRPSSFTEVVDQEHVVKVLENSVSAGRISHAYLFSGSRGTGKTSVARIFAGALGTSQNDLYEIDAASNRGIDDVRAIRDAVHVLPLESSYKVYIVDEVHMLTKEAFNALLKTLEEPPAHVIFILATTEIDKLPETVISRCQVFSFKKPSRETLRETISAVAKKEGFTLEAGTADLIALLGDGSFRDALGTLDKVLSSGKKVISLEHVERITGAPRNSLVNDFISALARHDAPKALTALSGAAASGIDIKVFLTLVLEKARFILLLKTNPASRKGVEERLSADDFKLIESLAALGPAAMTSSVLVELLRAYDEVSRAHIPSLPLELAVIKIASSKEPALNNPQK